MTTEVNPERMETFLHKVVADLAASYGGIMVSVGDKLGLYRALREIGPADAPALAAEAGCAERYVREWLNAQAAAGYVQYNPGEGTYELTPEQAAVFADTDSEVFFPPAWQVPASMWFDEHKTLEAFRTGKGVAWSDHDDRLFCGVAAFFRNGYRANLVSKWIPALDDVERKLVRGAKAVDVGCGHGHSTVFMAEAYPKSQFLGLDTHASSIAAARRNAEAAAVGNVRFEIPDGGDFAPGDADLICFFDCLHDLGHPAAAAANALRSLKPGGTVLLVEPYANDRPEHNHNPVGQIYYSASTTLCCAHALSENGTHALGAQAGYARLEQIFREAGFSRFRLAAQTPFNLVLEARP